MAQIWRDFADDPVSSDAPAGFTVLGSYVDCGVGEDEIEGKYLHFRASLDGRRLRWDDPGVITGDLHLYMLVRQGATHPNYYPGPMARYQDISNYVGASAYPSGDTVKIRVRTSGTNDDVTGPDVDFYTDQLATVELICAGGDITFIGRRYSDDSLLWSLTRNGDPQTAGHVGLVTFSNTSGKRIYGFGLGTDGDPAPTGPVGGGGSSTTISQELKSVIQSMSGSLIFNGDIHSALQAVTQTATAATPLDSAIANITNMVPSATQQASVYQVFNTSIHQVLGRLSQSLSTSTGFLFTANINQVLSPVYQGVSAKNVFFAEIDNTLAVLFQSATSTVTVITFNVPIPLGRMKGMKRFLGRG